MRIFALELDNDVAGTNHRKGYIEDLIARLPSPDLVVLPEMALCGYKPNQGVWRHADEHGKRTSAWATEMARRYDTFVGVGYVDKEDGDYYNRYLIAGPDGVCGVVSKSEGEAAVFRRGDFGNVIDTPFGKVAVAICYDSRRRRFYEHVKDKEISLILFPHGEPADPTRSAKVRGDNFNRCMAYVDAFGVPVVYANSKGGLPLMPGIMGKMMEWMGFRLLGGSRIYAEHQVPIETDMEEAIGADTEVTPRTRRMGIQFHGDDIMPGNWLFRNTVLRLDTLIGTHDYDTNKGGVPSL